MDGEEIALVDAKAVSGINGLQDLVNEVWYGTAVRYGTPNTTKLTYSRHALELVDPPKKVALYIRPFFFFNFAPPPAQEGVRGGYVHMLPAATW